MFTLTLRADDLERQMVLAHRNFPRATRALLVNLTAQAERRAVELASGGNAPARSYPIPQRRNVFRNSFGIEVDERRGAVYNAARYAQALHDGFRPYGNTHAIPVPGRPYFRDALDRIDPESAQAAFDTVLGGP